MYAAGVAQIVCGPEIHRVQMEQRKYKYVAHSGQLQVKTLPESEVHLEADHQEMHP